MNYQKWGEDEIKFLRENANKMSLEELALNLNRSEGSVRKYANRNDIELMSTSADPVYTDEVIEEVRRLLEKTAFTHKKISELTGVNLAYVSQIKTGRRRATKGKPQASNVCAGLSSKNSSLIRSIFR